ARTRSPSGGYTDVRRRLAPQINGTPSIALTRPSEHPIDPHLFHRIVDSDSDLLHGSAEAPQKTDPPRPLLLGYSRADQARDVKRQRARLRRYSVPMSSAT